MIIMLHKLCAFFFKNEDTCEIFLTDESVRDL